MASPLDAVAVKYLSLVKNFLKDDPRKLVQFLRVQRLLTMRAIQPNQWVKLVSELFSGNNTLLKATAALARISQSQQNPGDHLAYKVAALATRSSGQGSPSPNREQFSPPAQQRPTPLTAIVPQQKNKIDRFFPVAVTPGRRYVPRFVWWGSVFYWRKTQTNECVQKSTTRHDMGKTQRQWVPSSG
jgi:hypothetical protein